MNGEVDYAIYLLRASQYLAKLEDAMRDKQWEEARGCAMMVEAAVKATGEWAERRIR